jgi:hypothetical protein
MAKEPARIRKVSNFYGPRSVDEGRISSQHVGANEFTTEIAFHGDDYNTVIEEVIPKGYGFQEASLEVLEVFALTGTSPAIRIGTKTSEATNGVNLTKALLEAAGYSYPASTGTWTDSSILAADTIVGIALSGTTPVVGAVGHAILKITWRKAN